MPLKADCSKGIPSPYFFNSGIIAQVLHRDHVPVAGLALLWADLTDALLIGGHPLVSQQ